MRRQNQIRSDSVAFDQSDCGHDHQCEAAKAGLPKRASFQFTLQEDIALDVVRKILAMYLTSDVRHWHAAIDFAEMRLGEDTGASLVTSVASFVRALRIERTCPFNFISFACRHLAQDELDLMSVLQASCIGPHHELQEALRHLAQSDDFERLERAAVQVGVALRVNTSRPKRALAMPSADGAPSTRHLH